MKGKRKSELVAEGVAAAERGIHREDKIWAEFSGDKPDIASHMARAIRHILRDMPENRKLHALSIGSGPSPMLQLLAAFFTGQVNLLDIDTDSLKEIGEKASSLNLSHINTIDDDYTSILIRERDAERFYREELGGRRQHMVTLHHSLYYTSQENWLPLFTNVKKHVLAEDGAIHAVLMHPRSNDKSSTTWLYNHFAGKFKGVRNEQDLTTFADELRESRTFRNWDISCTSSKIRFFVNDFSKLMAVVWMILLYPEVHRYTKQQREEITEYIHDHMWIREEALVQHQDHLVITRQNGKQ